MGMISHGVAFGLGYACARPEGRLRDRAWLGATSKVMAANVSLAQKARRGSGGGSAAPVADAADADVAAGVGFDAALVGHAGNLHRAATPDQPAGHRS